MFVGCLLPGYAQTSYKDLAPYNAMFDPQYSKTGFILNKGFISTDRMIRSTMDNQNPDDFVISSPFDWKQLYRSLQLSETASKSILPDLKKLLTTYPHDQIPIGIINIEGEYLDPELISSYYDMGRNKLKANAPYARHTLLAVSNLKGTVKVGEANFVLSPKLYFSNSKEKPLGLEIDFGDGLGYRRYALSEQVVKVKYKNIGEHSIRFKLLLNSGTQLSYSKVEVTGLEQPRATTTGTVTSGGGAGSRTVPNGYYEIYNGCDGVLDRPVIIVEGFNPLGGSSDFTSMYNLYFNNLSEDLMNAGYDIVLLKFANNNTYIEDNAQVLKALLNDINSLKSGNYENVVVGESMGGLVTRIALAQMDAAHIDHEVGLYVSFDSPHKGANIPLGMQKFAADAADIEFVEITDLLTDLTNLFSFGAGGLPSEIFDEEDCKWCDPYTVDDLNTLVQANNSPAAMEMLIRHYLAPGGPNPAYVSFQSFLNTTGFPVESRNVALINGSNHGAQQTTSDSPAIPVNIGDQFVDAHIGSQCGAIEFYFDIWVSPVNTTAKVSDLEIWFSGPLACLPKGRTTDKEGTFTFDQHPWDIAPGGYQSANVPKAVDGYITRDRFDFVPSVSSIALNDALINGTNGLYYFDNQNVSRAKAELVRLNQTPFDDIYSNPGNTKHVIPRTSNFDGVATMEIMPDNKYLQNKTIVSGRKRDFKASATILSGNNVTPPTWNKLIDQADFVVASGAEVNFIAGTSITLRPGFKAASGSVFKAKIQANNSCTSSLRMLADTETPALRFAPLPDIEVLKKDNDVALNIINYEDTLSGVSYTWRLTGENFELNSSTKRFDATGLKPGQYTAYASVNNGERVSSKVFHVAATETSKQAVMPEKELLKEDAVTIYPNPSSKDITVSYENEFAGNVQIYLTDVTGKAVRNLSNGAKGSGSYADTFDISAMPSGVYLLVIEKGSAKSVHQLIIVD